MSDINAMNKDCRTSRNGHCEGAEETINFNSRRIKLFIFVPFVCLFVALSTLVFAALYKNNGVYLVLPPAGTYACEESGCELTFSKDGKTVAVLVGNNSQGVDYTYEVYPKNGMNYLSMSSDTESLLYKIVFDGDNFTLENSTDSQAQLFILTPRS